VIDICVPKLGLVLEDVAITAVLVAVGDHVRVGHPLVEIEGDKSTFEVDADCDGVVAEVLVEAGETANIGDVLVRIDPTTASKTPQGSD